MSRWFLADVFPWPREMRLGSWYHFSLLVISYYRIRGLAYRNLPSEFFAVLQRQSARCFRMAKEYLLVVTSISFPWLRGLCTVDIRLWSAKEACFFFSPYHLARFFHIRFLFLFVSLASSLNLGKEDSHGYVVELFSLPEPIHFGDIQGDIRPISESNKSNSWQSRILRLEYIHVSEAFCREGSWPSLSGR